MIGINSMRWRARHPQEPDTPHPRFSASTVQLFNFDSSFNPSSVHFHIMV
jgi:hypothetical protein